jgi:hypothetical protein
MRFVNEKRLPNLLFYGPPGTGSIIIKEKHQLLSHVQNSFTVTNMDQWY